MKHILFICSANKDRSRTAEDYFSSNYKQYLFDSAGTNKKTCSQLGTNYLDEDQLSWADSIFVMEQKHFNQIRKIYGNSFSSKIEVLNIKDLYKYGEKDLVALLVKKVLNLVKF
jgi:predicted protein tyrosine phosphatase